MGGSGGGRRSGRRMIKGSANCVTDRQRRMPLDGVTCILISSKWWGGSRRVEGWWEFLEVGPCFDPITNCYRATCSWTTKPLRTGC